MRILFVKTSSLGDVIHQCPALTDVRRRYPDALIDWVVEETFAGLVALHPAVRRVVPVAVRRWRRGTFRPSVWKEVSAFRHFLGSETYDFVIDSQGLLKSALIALAANGERHGFDAESAREPIASRFYDVRHRVSRNIHAVERNRELTAISLGIHRAGDCDYGLIPRPEPLNSMTSPFCVLLSMTSRPEKLWPEKCWGDLVKTLAAQGCESVFPWGSEAERTRCNRIVDLAGSGLVLPALSLGEIASKMSRARNVIGVDTGLTHLAVALKVPSVALYVCSDPVLTGLHGTGRLVNLGGVGQMPTAQDALDALKAIS